MHRPHHIRQTEQASESVNLRTKRADPHNTLTHALSPSQSPAEFLTTTAKIPFHPSPHRSPSPSLQPTGNRKPEPEFRIGSREINIQNPRCEMRDYKVQYSRLNSR